MDGMLQWGLGIVRAVQTVQSPALTVVMKGASLIGSVGTYFLLISFLYWCVDERRGFRLAVAALVSAWVNDVLKVLFRQPRPYNLDPGVELSREPTYGLPSGHAQGAVVFCGIVGAWLRKPLVIVLTVLFPLLVSFSRVYLGVHFPTDIFGAWLLGAAVLVGYFLLGPRLEAALKAAGPRAQVIVVVVVAYLMNALHPENVSFGGVFLGTGAGYALMASRFPFSASRRADGGPATPGLLVLRFILGLSVAGLLYFLLKAVFPGAGSGSYRIFRFLRYGVLGFWVTAGAPFVFLRLRLAGGR